MAIHKPRSADYRDFEPICPYNFEIYHKNVFPVEIQVIMQNSEIQNTKKVLWFLHQNLNFAFRTILILELK